MLIYHWWCENCGYSHEEKTKRTGFILKEEIEEMVSMLICPDCGEDLINLNES